MRPSQTFQKRQRELARQEKQRAKAQRKQQRKLEKQTPGADVVDSTGDNVIDATDVPGSSDTPVEPAPERAL